MTVLLPMQELISTTLNVDNCVREPFEVLLKLTSLNASLRRPFYFVRVTNFVESLGIE